MAFFQPSSAKECWPLGDSCWPKWLRVPDRRLHRILPDSSWKSLAKCRRSQLRNVWATSKKQLVLSGSTGPCKTPKRILLENPSCSFRKRRHVAAIHGSCEAHPRCHEPAAAQRKPRHMPQAPPLQTTSQPSAGCSPQPQAQADLLQVFGAIGVSGLVCRCDSKVGCCLWHGNACGNCHLQRKQIELVPFAKSCRQLPAKACHGRCRPCKDFHRGCTIESWPSASSGRGLKRICRHFAAPDLNDRPNPEKAKAG